MTRSFESDGLKQGNICRTAALEDWICPNLRGPYLLWRLSNFYDTIQDLLAVSFTLSFLLSESLWNNVLCTLAPVVDV